MAWTTPAATDLRFGFFWVFPITWIATHFVLSMMIASLATVGVIIVAIVIGLQAVGLIWISRLNRSAF